MFIPKGVDIPALDIEKLWDYTTTDDWKVGDIVTGGDVIGTVYENGLFKVHRIMIPPNIKGKISKIMESG
jgi:vacuolar-type H+-ATPase catalytic subunit A/Vma1